MNRNSTQKPAPAERGIRPGVLALAAGAMAATAVLFWGFRSHPAAGRPAERSQNTGAAVSPQAAAEDVPSKPARYRLMSTSPNPAGGAGVSTPLAADPVPLRLPPATRMSSPGMSPDPGAPGAAGLAGVETFDYQAQAAVSARAAAALAAQVAGALAAGSAPPPSGGQGLAMNGFTSPSGQAGRGPSLAPQPPAGGGAQPGPALLPAGAAGAGSYASPASAGPAAEGGRSALTAPDIGGYAGVVAPASGPPGNQEIHNAVEAYREAERLRRAYVEQQRLGRITTIAEARQKEGIF